MLTVEINEPKRGWRPLKYILFSPPKVGKSYLGTQFHPNGWKKVLVIDTENGTDEYQCNRIKVQTPEELHEAFAVAYKSKFETVVVDVIDPIYNWGNQQAVASYNARTGQALLDISEIEGYGTGWALARKQFLNMIKPIDHLKAIGKSVVMVAHMKSPNDTMGMARVRTVDLPGALSRILAGDSDAIGLLSVDKKGIRKISFRPYELIDAGCRAPELEGKEFVLPKDDPFKNIREAFEAAENMSAAA